MDGDNARLLELFQAPATERDDFWRDRLNAAFWPAYLGSFTTHVVFNDFSRMGCYRLGRDEFDGGQPPSNCASLVDYAIHEGIGLILWPSDEPQPLWEMRLGDVLSYRLYGTAFAPRFWNEPPDEEGPRRLNLGESWQVGSPNEQMFPGPVRNAVRHFMQTHLGISTPKVLLAKPPDRGSRLVFELDPAVLGGDEGAKRAFAAIHWHIPSCIPVYRVDSMTGSEEMRAF